MIIGVTGFLGSGKSYFANLLVDNYGFERLSFGDEVRFEARKRGIESIRKNLQALGDLERKEKGGDIWAKRLIGKTEIGKNYVIEGVRNPEEIVFLRKISGFLLVGIDVPFEVRCERILLRARAGDLKTKEEFAIADAKDKGTQEEGYGQHSDFCFNKSDVVIENSGSLEEFGEKAGKLLEEIRRTKEGN